jgi:ADP-ribosyl-[dinitrogen reductase] hydrolase
MPEPMDEDFARIGKGIVRIFRMKTSVSHPLRIAAVSGGSKLGRVGLTLCPGKFDPHGASGAWNRDVGLDLNAIRDWGAAAVITLVTADELACMKVERLGEEVLRRQMSWFHLPIVDGSIPDDRFERDWGAAGEGLRSILRGGFDVLVHCRGGLGRAGTIAARLLIELGMEPTTAIEMVRQARSPQAIETIAQEQFVHSLGPVPERSPGTTVAAIRDRAIGAILGLAVGDAVGTTLEFKQRDTYEPLRDMVGGGPFGLKPGEWTDDTSMALCLADSLIETKGQFDPADLMQRFVRWRDDGENSVNGRGCFDIGNTTNAALNRWLRLKDPYAGSADPKSAGNGSLMRLAPVAIRFWNDRDRLRHTAGQQSRTTHAAQEAIDACAMFADMVADAIEGRQRSDVLRKRTGPYAGKIQESASASWRSKPRDQIASSGYVAHSLEAALWCVGSTADFKSAILKAANLGSDSDTTAAIAGQLAGALYGTAGIPRHWLEGLAERKLIEERASDLFRQSVATDTEPRAVTVTSEQTLLSGQAAQFIFRALGGSVVTLGGIDGAALRELIDQAEHISDDRRALFVRLQPAGTVEAYVEQVIAVLAETAMRLWPVWFTDTSFAMCCDDALGRQAAGVIAREAVPRVPGVSSTWTKAAARLALAGCPPRVVGVLPAIELAQLSLAISRTGLVLVADVSAAAVAPSATALAHALEWVALHSGNAVVALFAALPPLDSPFDRILYGARRVIPDTDTNVSVLEPEARESIGSETWLTPWRGAPHPLSEIEQRLATMLSDDTELTALFCFNWFVDTVRGTRPKVDLVWIDGRLVVELDGYPDHATRGAFIGDRHRDYELALSGYTVLRLANDEVMQDFGRAIEKIRDLVRLRRSQMNQEG